MGRLLRKLTGILPDRAVDTVLDWAQEHMFEKWDQRLLGLNKLDVRTIIDIGANKGQSARKFLTIFPRAEIHCFEPVNTAYSVLCKLAQKEQRVFPHQLALGDSEGTIQFFQHLRYSQSSSPLPTTSFHEAINPVVQKHREISVPQETLDGACASMKIELNDVALVKIDVQGYEDRVIRGGTSTLKKSGVCITEISHSALYEGQATFNQIYEMLTPLGYLYLGNLDQSISRDGVIRYFDAIWIQKSLYLENFSSR